MRSLVGSDGSDLNTVFGVCGSSVDERGTNDGHGVVSSVDNEHTDELLDTVDNEVATKLIRLFSFVDKFLGRKTFEMTAI